jgi:hypothetical protein
MRAWPPPSSTARSTRSSTARALRRPGRRGARAAGRRVTYLLSRRRLLHVGGATAALLAGASWLSLRGATKDHDAVLAQLVGPYDPVVLSRGELAVLAVVVERLIGAVPPLPTTYAVRLPERIDKELSFHGPKMQDDVKQALVLIEHGGVLHGSLARFTTLSAEEQDARLQAMCDGIDVERQVFVALRTLATFFFYADERTWPHIHYQGTLVGFRTPPAADSRVT